MSDRNWFHGRAWMKAHLIPRYVSYESPCNDNTTRDVTVYACTMVVRRVKGVKCFAALKGRCEISTCRNRVWLDVTFEIVSYGTSAGSYSVYIFCPSLNKDAILVKKMWIYRFVFEAAFDIWLLFRRFSEENCHRRLFFHFLTRNNSNYFFMNKNVAR